MTQITLLVKVTSIEKVSEALEIIKVIKENHPNVSINIEVIV